MSLTIRDEEREREIQEQIERLRAISREVREEMRKQGWPLEEGEELSLKIGDMLYDEHGLPK